MYYSIVIIMGKQRVSYLLKLTEWCILCSLAFQQTNMVGLPFPPGLVSIMDTVGPTWLTSVFSGIIMSIIVSMSVKFCRILCNW